MTASPDLHRLVELVARLRAPDGCPWDREQTLASVRAYLLEEAHELADAIDQQDWDQVAEELGDLLFQTAFIARLGEEAGALTAADAIEGVYRKMIERHPHVFGDGDDRALKDRAAVEQAWERRKLARKKATDGGLLAGAPRSLPALAGAYRLTQKAAGVGFDWHRAGDVLDKIEEEIGELRGEIEAQDGPRQSEEIGDLLFAVANLARKLEIDPEAALAGANGKFRRRFRHIEERLEATGRQLETATLAEMDALWDEAKALERRG
ncbi:MAG: nucleoside triphosphate pyrophosphohydrolase [Acidobacteriota bacterium]